MKKYIFLFLFLPFFCAAQLTITVNSIPKNTPPNSTIYIAGNFNNWNPAKDSLTKKQNGTYQITISPTNGLLEYKFTRGAWSSVEGTSANGFLPNRSYNYQGGTGNLTLTIDGWEGQTTTTSTKAANVLIVNDFDMPQFNKKRRLWIYLPPDYAQNNNKYRVLYMLDGQNLFDKSTAFGDEWKVDETLNKLYAEGDNGVIVVGIDNGGASRIDEYTPWSNPKYGGGNGKKYMQFMVETLKPYIDANYRTLSNRQNTAIGGSSLGGLESFFGAIENQNIYSKGMIFSPSFWWNPNCYQQVKNIGKQQNMRFYFLAGGSEEPDDDVVFKTKDMVSTLENNDFDTTAIKAYYPEYGQHNEAFWSNEFKAAYLWLFQKTTAVNEVSQDEIKVSPNPSSDSVLVQNNSKYQILLLEIFDINGRKVNSVTIDAQSQTIDIQSIKKGIYQFMFIDKSTNKSVLTKKMVIQ